MTYLLYAINETRFLCPDLTPTNPRSLHESRVFIKQDQICIRASSKCSFLVFDSEALCRIVRCTLDGFAESASCKFDKVSHAGIKRHDAEVLVRTSQETNDKVPTFRLKCLFLRYTTRRLSSRSEYHRATHGLRHACEGQALSGLSEKGH